MPTLDGIQAIQLVDNGHGALALPSSVTVPADMKTLFGDRTAFQTLNGSAIQFK